MDPELVPPGMCFTQGLPTDQKQVSTPTLRTAAAEALLSGALLCADVDRGVAQWHAKPNTERFLKALEALRDALS